MFLRPQTALMFGLSFASITAVSQAIDSTSLAASLLSDPVLTDFSSINGEQVKLRPFSFTLLANKTHVQASLNVSQDYSEIGWIALGLGTSMSDSAMVVIWPTEDSQSWVVSHRTASGHAKPDFDPSIDSSTPGRWTVVPALTTLDAQPSSTVVTLVRELSLPKNQGVYPSSRAKYVNLSRNKGQKLIWAASSRRPSGDQEGSTMTMHDPRMFGIFEIDLSQKWIAMKKATGDSPTSTEMSHAEHGTNGWSKYDKILVAHAAFAMLTWLLVTPAAVLIARLGRRWGSWFQWHSKIHLFGTLPLTLVAMSLGVAAVASMGSVTSLDAHKTLGIVLVLLVLFQLALGQLSHLSHFTPSRGSTRPLIRVFHILVGVTTLPVAWATIYFGIEEWYEHSDKAPHRALEIVWAIGIGLFVLPYVVSLYFLSIQRFKEGRSLYQALFGLGQSTASPAIASHYRGREWARGLPASFGSARNSFINDGAGGATGGNEGVKRRSLSVEVLVEKQEGEREDWHR